MVRDKDLRVYKPRCFDSKLEQHRIPTGDSGLALVDSASIPGTPLWSSKSTVFQDASVIVASFRSDLDDAKTPHQQYCDEDNDPDSKNYIDWASWTLPTLNVAFFRRTGQSCCVNDWKDLEKDYVSWEDADWAKRHTSKYIKKAIRDGHYTSYNVQHIYCATALGGNAMGGYGKVEDYAAAGMEIPPTATIRRGKAFAKGNYFNTTKRLNLPSIYGLGSE